MWRSKNLLKLEHTLMWTTVCPCMYDRRRLACAVFSFILKGPAKTHISPEVVGNEQPPPGSCCLPSHLQAVAAHFPLPRSALPVQGKAASCLLLAHLMWTSCVWNSSPLLANQQQNHHRNQVTASLPRETARRPCVRLVREEKSESLEWWSHCHRVRLLI